MYRSAPPRRRRIEEASGERKVLLPYAYGMLRGMVEPLVDEPLVDEPLVDEPVAVRSRVSRGTLSRDDVLRTTVELIEANPDQPITMERVARALGTRPMSLYTHVRNRDDLIEGAFARSLAEWKHSTIDTSEAPGVALWEQEVRAWCRSLREHARRYSPLIQQMSTNGRFNPALLEKVALLMTTLRNAGLEGRALADAVRWIPQTVLGAIVLELSRPAHLQSIDDEAAAIYGSLLRLGATARAEFADVLPHFADQSLDDLFEYSIDRLIDGLRRQAALTSTEGDSDDRITS